MKNTKRILAVLLLMALLVSCLLLTASAEDPSVADETENFESVLEYYELDDYLADNYESGAWNEACYVGVNSEVVADPTDDTNKVLKVTGKNNKYGAASLTEKLVVSFNIYYESTMDGEYRVDIKTVDASGAESITYTTMFSVNAGESVFQNSVWDDTLNNGDGGFVVTDFEGITPVADTWYNVVLFFNAVEGVYSFKISDDNGENWVYSDSYSFGNVEKVSCFELKAYAKGRTGTVSLYLDEIEVYSGTFERNPSDKKNVTAQALIDLETLYLDADTDSETKVRIAVVFDKLVNIYGFDPDDSIADANRVREIINNVPEYINCAYAEEFVTRASRIDTSLGYYDRLAYVDECNYYGEFLPANDALSAAPGLDSNAELVEAVIGARALFEAELLACQTVVEHSGRFVAKMLTYDPEEKDYDGYLKPFYEELLLYTELDFTYSESIDGVGDFTMADAVALFEELETKYLRLDAAANTFIDGANAMLDALEIMNGSAPGEDAYEQAFASLAEGYALCDSVYNGGNIDSAFDASTHAELSSLFYVYLDNQQFILEQIESCQDFLDIMKMASTATYYTAILEHLDDAENCLDNVRMAYEGVPEAYALYTSLKDYIESAEIAAEAYIAAVEAINDSMSFADKQAAVNSALLLKEQGDVIGFDGVVEANVKLSEEKTKIETLIVNSDTVKVLVAQIENATTFAERRALLAQAMVAASNCEESLDGVASAVEKLEGFIADYAEQVQAMNEAHENAAKAAADLAGAASSDAGVYKAADIIKNYIG